MKLSPLLLLVVSFVGTVNAVGSIRGNQDRALATDDFFVDVPITSETETETAETDAPTGTKEPMMMDGNYTMMPSGTESPTGDMSTATAKEGHMAAEKDEHDMMMAAGETMGPSYTMGPSNSTTMYPETDAPTDAMM